MDTVSANKFTANSTSINNEELEENDNNNDDDEYQNRKNYFFKDKFRIILSCYLLLGITLAIYSRNALSLAVVGMVANNEVNNELVNILQLAANENSNSFYSNQNNRTTRTTVELRIKDALDGSCPVMGGNKRESLYDGGADVYAKIASTSPLLTSNLYHPSSSSSSLEYTNFLQSSSADSNDMAALVKDEKFLEQERANEIERAYRAHIRRRVESGELVDWSPSEQGLIFAAGSVGNLLIAIPLTRMGELYGPKWVIFVALFGATIQAALMPLISPCHISLVIIFQVIFCGLTFGADCVAYTFFAHWLTPIEMAFFVSCLLICYQLGNIISSFVTASILTRQIDWSWCFYAPAILCGIWSIVWAIIGASEPATSYFISRKELNYIIKSNKLVGQQSTISATNDYLDRTNLISEQEQVVANGRDVKKTYYGSVSGFNCLNSSIKSSNNSEHSSSSSRYNVITRSQHLTTRASGQEEEQGANNDDNNNNNNVSYKKLMKDPNIWAIIAVKFTLRWYFSVYASLMPTYLSSVTHMSVDTIGNMSVFQSFIGLFSGILMSYLTKSVILKRPFNLSLAAFRKTFQSIVNFGLSLSLLIFIIFDCNQWVTIVALTISGICINFYVAAALQLPTDLSPSYCGLITSISNTLALGQALGAPISGLILNGGPKDRTLWRIVWGLAILLNTLSGLLFILLVDSKPRDYNKNDANTFNGYHIIGTTSQDYNNNNYSNSNSNKKNEPSESSRLLA